MSDQRELSQMSRIFYKPSKKQVRGESDWSLGML